MASDEGNRVNLNPMTHEGSDSQEVHSSFNNVKSFKIQNPHPHNFVIKFSPPKLTQRPNSFSFPNHSRAKIKRPVNNENLLSHFIHHLISRTKKHLARNSIVICSNRARNDGLWPRRCWEKKGARSSRASRGKKLRGLRQLSRRVDY